MFPHPAPYHHFNNKETLHQVFALWRVPKGHYPCNINNDPMIGLTPNNSGMLVTPQASELGLSSDFKLAVSYINHSGFKTPIAYKLKSNPSS